MIFKIAKTVLCSLLLISVTIQTQAGIPDGSTPVAKVKKPKKTPPPHPRAEVIRFQTINRKSTVATSPLKNFSNLSGDAKTCREICENDEPINYSECGRDDPFYCHKKNAEGLVGKCTIKEPEEEGQASNSCTFVEFNIHEPNEKHSFPVWVEPGVIYHGDD